MIILHVSTKCLSAKLFSTKRYGAKYAPARIDAAKKFAALTPGYGFAASFGGKILRQNNFRLVPLKALSVRPGSWHPLVVLLAVVDGALEL
jgi:hypothetical protein